MDETNLWPELFLKSSFYSINKNDFKKSSFDDLKNKMIFDEVINQYHPERKNEFILGRVCAYKAYQKLLAQELLSLPINQDRSPLWPAGVLGSITHNQYWVGAAVALSSDLFGVGIDFEVMGRVKIGLSAYLRHALDIKNVSGLSEEELLTLIFSSKESLYKALFPKVKKYFGFQAAALRLVDLEKGIFIIELLENLNPDFGRDARSTFEGRFFIKENTCLTVLEIIL